MSDFIEQLLALPGYQQELAANSTLFQQADKVENLYLVISGEVELVRHLADGQAMVLQRARAGAVVAEASVYSDQYHCRADCVEPACLYQVGLESLHQLLATDTDFAMAWGRYLAQSVQKARLRSEMLSRKTVAQRLDCWLAEYGELPAKGHWQGLAKELAVTHEALYRELAKRR